MQGANGALLVPGLRFHHRKGGRQTLCSHRGRGALELMRQQRRLPTIVGGTVTFQIQELLGNALPKLVQQADGKFLLAQTTAEQIREFQDLLRQAHRGRGFRPSVGRGVRWWNFHGFGSDG